MNSRPTETLYKDKLYDFLYEREYEAWFCNLSRRPTSIRGLNEWFLQIHTGESLVSATPTWSWDQRRALGQQYLTQLARDFLVWYDAEERSKYTDETYGPHRDELGRRLEMDGYVLRDCELYQPEVEVLDVEAERGLLEGLYSSLGLAESGKTFEFLRLAEEHYVAGRWSDCIGNARKFFESVAMQVAAHHHQIQKGTPILARTLERPVEVRQYLEQEGLIEHREREALDKIYGLLSHTGGHPYMAEKDQARLLRQISLTITQFIMLRLEGALGIGLP